MKTIHLIGKGPTAKEGRGVIYNEDLVYLINDSDPQDPFNKVFLDMANVETMKFYRLMTDGIDRFNEDQLKNMKFYRSFTTAVFCLRPMDWKLLFYTCPIYNPPSKLKISDQDELLNPMKYVHVTSTTATYALQIAFMYGNADRVIMYGIDFPEDYVREHGFKMDSVRYDFRRIYQAAQEKGKEIFLISNQSALADIIPVFNG